MLRSKLGRDTRREIAEVYLHVSANAVGRCDDDRRQARHCERSGLSAEARRRKQSKLSMPRQSGLLRRCAPRNDGVWARLPPSPGGGGSIAREAGERGGVISPQTPVPVERSPHPASRLASLVAGRPSPSRGGWAKSRRLHARKGRK